MAAHKTIRISLVKFIQDFIANLDPIHGITSPVGVQFFDFDAHSEETELPVKDLIGLADLSWAEDEKTYEVMVSIGVSTTEDPNLFRHHDIIDALSSVLRVEDQVNLVDPATGSVIGWMVAQNGVSLLPMARTKVRGLQFLMVRFLTSQIA